MGLDIPLICTLIAIIVFLYTSYTDVKWGIIQNKITLPLISLGIILNVIYSITVNNIWIIGTNLMFVTITFIISYILWKWGIFGGGLVKLATAMAALLPFYLPILNSNYNVVGIELPIDANYGFTFIINSILSIVSFLLIYIMLSWIRESLKSEFRNEENRESL